MSSESVLSFEPQELSFQFELNKQLSTSLRLFNNTENHIIFKLLTTNPKNYGVRPRVGVLSPGSACEIAVTKRAMRETPHNMICKDKFMIQTAIASPGATTEDARSMFCNEAGNVFQECKLRVVYNVPLPEIPLPLPSVIVEEPPDAPTGSDNLIVSEVIEFNIGPDKDAVQVESNIGPDVDAVQVESNIGPDEDAVQSDQTESNPEETGQQKTPGSVPENDSYFRGELITRGIIICLLGLLLCYVMKHTLSLIWSLSMIIIMLMMKMLKKLVSESVEDWIVKALLYIFMHIFLKRRENTRPSSQSA